MRGGKAIWGCLIIIGSLLGYSANASQYAFQVTFTDKNNTPYSLSSPLAYLSPRALSRRATQGISIDSTDLPVNPAYVDSVLSLTGGKLHETSRWLNMCMILLSDSSQILHLAGKPYISNITLVGYYTTNLHRSMNTTGGGNKNTAQRTTSSGSAYYGNTWTQTQLVNGNYLHDNGYKGQGKLIAVLDAGFIGADTHPGFDSLWQSGRVVDTFDFTFDNTNVFYQDNHGFEVLSTMAGYVPGTYVGSAPLAMYALYITEYDLIPNDQPLELDNMLCGAERADSIGADIITESLGYDLFDYPPGSGQSFYPDLDGKTTVAAKAANMATKKGMLFVASAGNDGTGIGGWGNHIMTPGDADSALTIGAVSQSGIVANFSGYGPNAAGQVKPDVCGMGLSAAIFNAPGGYSSLDGTSLSTPQVAGWAACLWQANPNATPYQLRQAIIKCASSYNSPGQQLGYGIPDFECAQLALDVTDTPPPFSASNWVIPTPNPFGSDLKLCVSPNAGQYVGFTLMDMTGKIVFSFNIYLYKGYNTPINIPTPALPSGIYILRVISPTQQQVIKLEKR
ncbi:MAG: S8 family peptidase [Chitinophagales bacterium]